MTAVDRDFYETLDDIRDGGGSWDPAEVVNVDGAQSVPFRCRDCHRPAYYDTTDDLYHHAADPGTGCFLIAAEDREPDLRHPDLFAWEPAVGDRFRQRDDAPWHADGVRGVHRHLVVCEVTDVDAVRVGYRVAEILEETGRPPFIDGERHGWTGGVAIYALPWMVATGVIEVLP